MVFPQTNGADCRSFIPAGVARKETQKLRSQQVTGAAMKIVKYGTSPRRRTSPRRPFCAEIARYRSISPITMSNDPTIAGTSAIRQLRHSSLVIDRLQNELLRARARQGIELPSLTR